MKDLKNIFSFHHTCDDVFHQDELKRLQTQLDENWYNTYMNMSRHERIPTGRFGKDFQVRIHASDSVGRRRILWSLLE